MAMLKSFKVHHAPFIRSVSDVSNLVTVMSFNIELRNGSSTVFTFENAVQNALGQVSYGNLTTVNPEDGYAINFGSDNGLGTIPDYSPYTATLYTNGCLQADGSNNCTAACLSPNATFSDMYTLSNCVAYLVISVSLAAGNLTDHAESIAKQFGITERATVQNLVYNTTYDCLTELCSTVIVTEDGCDVESVCASVPVLINSDVGGIGVRVFDGSCPSQEHRLIRTGVYFVLDAESLGVHWWLRTHSLNILDLLPYCHHPRYPLRT